MWVINNRFCSFAGTSSCKLKKLENVEKGSHKITVIVNNIYLHVCVVLGWFSSALTCSQSSDAGSSRHFSRTSCTAAARAREVL